MTSGGTINFTHIPEN